MNSRYSGKSPTKRRGAIEQLINKPLLVAVEVRGFDSLLERQAVVVRLFEELL